MNSIFQRANPAIEKIFTAAGSPRKVMCIPIDYAKRQHTALVCNGEDCGAFAFNFIHSLLEAGRLGIGLNAYDASVERKNQIASTDKLALRRMNASTGIPSIVGARLTRFCDGLFGPVLKVTTAMRT